MSRTSRPLPPEPADAATAAASARMRLERNLWWRGADTLLLMVGMAITLLFVWVAYFEHKSTELGDAVEATVERNQNLVIALGQYTIRVIKTAEAVASYVGGEIARGESAARLREIAVDRAANNQFISEVLVVDAVGRPVASSRSPSLAPADLASSEFYLAHLRGAPVVRLGQPFRVPNSNHPMVPITRAVRDAAGALRAVVIVLVESDRMMQVFQDARVSGDVLVTLTGLDGDVQAAWRGRGGGTTRSLDRAVNFAELEEDAVVGGRVTRALDGQPRLVSVHRVRDYPLAAIAGTHEQDAFAEYAARDGKLFAACLGLTVMIVLLAAVLGRVNHKRGRMALALARAERRLRALNADLERKVSVRTAQLEVANRDLESFSYSVAHDVRAPLATIDGFTRMLEPAIAATADSRLAHYLQRIQASTLQMSQLTESLLALATVSRQPVHRQRVELSDLAQAIVDGLRDREPHRSVEVRIDRSLPERADPVLVRQLLENLLGNAWKFSANVPHAIIEFGLVPGEGGAPARYRVRDNGAGFDSAYQGKLFQPFQRLHSRQEFSGSGVGLATVRRIVELHGGSVGAESRPGQGASFWFTLHGGAADT